jgi:hypothetical protein
MLLNGAPVRRGRSARSSSDWLVARGAGPLAAVCSISRSAAGTLFNGGRTVAKKKGAKKGGSKKGGSKKGKKKR